MRENESTIRSRIGASALLGSYFFIAFLLSIGAVPIVLAFVGGCLHDILHWESVGEWLIFPLFWMIDHPVLLIASAIWAYFIGARTVWDEWARQQSFVNEDINKRLEIIESILAHRENFVNEASPRETSKR